MNKNILSILMLFSIAITACAQQKKTTSTSKSKTASQAGKLTAAPEIVSIRMSRGSCFGKCPTYRVEVFQSGLVRYSSIMFTEKVGVYEKNVGAAKTAALFKRFNDYRVDTTKDKYENLIQDLPGLNYEIRYATKTKPITNAGFGPHFLKTLSYEVDSLANPDYSWKRISDRNIQ